MAKQRLGVCEILDKASEFKTMPEKIQFLRDNADPFLGAVLRCLFDDSVQWAALPKQPIYQPSDFPGTEHNLKSHLTTIHYFFKGGKFDTLPPEDPKFKRQEMHRETQWLLTLESVHPRDAELLIALVEKKLPRFKGLMNRKILLHAYPELRVFIKEGDVAEND